jgi:hypothetical protein
MFREIAVISVSCTMCRRRPATVFALKRGASNGITLHALHCYCRVLANIGEP